MTDIQTLYDFDTPIEKSLAITLARQEIVTYSPSNALISAQDAADYDTISPNLPGAVDFQKQRPRVELASRLGAAAQEHFPNADFPPLGGYCHDMGRQVSVMFKVITDLNIGNHREFLSEVRAIMATILRDINGSLTMQYHKVQELSEASCSNAYQSEDGAFITDLIFSGVITMQTNLIPN